MADLDPGRVRRDDRLRPACAAVVPVGVFVLLLLLVEHGWVPLRRLDVQVSDGLHRFAVAHSTLVLAMKGVGVLGTSTAYAVLLAYALVWLLRRGRGRSAAFAVVTVVGGSVLNAVVKGAVDRARPVFADPVAHAGYSSFPSGHAQGVAVAGGVLLLLALPSVPAARRRLLVLAVLCWAALVAFSRVALGVHYPSDVVAGLALGAAWVLLCAAASGPGRLRREARGRVRDVG